MMLPHEACGGCTEPKEGLVAKLDTIAHTTLDNISSGSLVIENAQEFESLIRAIEHIGTLKRNEHK